MLYTQTHFFFIGIGGIGMSALARFFKLHGKEVFGYDATSTQLTKQLEQEGIHIIYEDEVTQLPSFFQQGKHDALIVYTPAIPKENKILNFLQQQYGELHKRAEVLGMITQEQESICIAGTHGKTSTSSLCAYIFQQTPQGCNAFLGGLVKNFNSNLCFSPQSKLCIIEADEFDRSFLHLQPYSALISTTDCDHKDIYENAEHVKRAFSAFTSKLKAGGNLLLHNKVDIAIESPSSVKIYRYSLKEVCDFYASNIRIVEGKYLFDLHTPMGHFSNLKLNMPGIINLENAIGASALALLHGVDIEYIKKALASFMGIKRRFDYRWQTEALCVIDDYAHHPTEIEALHTSLRELYPTQVITGIFQPHLYSRTQDFAEAFAQALQQFDRIILLDIYPAREKPIADVSSHSILSLIPKEKQACLSTAQELPVHLSKTKQEVIVFMGAGDLHLLIDPCIDYIMKKQ